MTVTKYALGTDITKSLGKNKEMSNRITNAYIEFVFSYIDDQLLDLRKYISFFEGTLLNTRENLIKSAENASSKLPKGHQWKAFDNIGEHLFYIDDLFSQIHRSSLFLTIYGLFEFELDFLCEALGNYYKLNLKPSNLRGKGIERSKNYFSKVNIPFPSNTKQWTQICKLKDIRNLIAHARGILLPDNQNMEIRKYIKNHECIDLHAIGNGTFFLRFNEKFCFSTIETIESFFHILKTVIDEKLQKEFLTTS